LLLSNVADKSILKLSQKLVGWLVTRTYRGETDGQGHCYIVTDGAVNSYKITDKIPKFWNYLIISATVKASEFEDGHSLASKSKSISQEVELAH